MKCLHGKVGHVGTLFVSTVWEKRKWRWLRGQRSFSLSLDSKPETRRMTSERRIIFITLPPLFKVHSHVSSPALSFIYSFFFLSPLSLFALFCHGCYYFSYLNGTVVKGNVCVVMTPALQTHLVPWLFFLQPYLKSWSQDLGVPILSVDYSLAPEAPFPRALEECFYAYCWALRNHHLLGGSVTLLTTHSWTETLGWGVSR